MVTDKVLDLYEQRQQLKYTSSGAGLEYRKVNREVREKMRPAMEE